MSMTDPKFIGLYFVNQLGVRSCNKQRADEILDGITEEDVTNLLRDVNRIIDNRGAPFLGCDPDALFLVRDGECFDPNFMALPDEWKQLGKSVRDFWRDWKGQWLDRRGQLKDCRRDFNIGGVTYDDDSVKTFEKFQEIFGRQAYRHLPIPVLTGPLAWISRLPYERQKEHMRWVFTVALIQSKCPLGYEGLRWQAGHLADVMHGFILPVCRCWSPLSMRGILAWILAWIIA